MADKSYHGTKGAIVHRSRSGEEEGRQTESVFQTEVVLLLPIDNDPTSHTYFVMLENAETILVSYHSIYVLPDDDASIERFVDRYDLVELMYQVVSGKLDDIERVERSDKANAEEISMRRDNILAATSLINLPASRGVVPNTAEEANALGDEWKLSMIDEFLSLIEMGTFTYHISSEVKRNESVMTCKWVFKIKEDGRKKSRLTARGFLQQKGIDYFESYASMVASASFRVGMAINVLTGFRIRKHYAKNAYCYADLPPEEQVWMRQPPGLEICGGQNDEIAQMLRKMGVHIPGKDGEELVLRLQKSLYGLVSAGRLFNKYIVAWALKCGFTQLRTDECLFIYVQTRHESDGKCY
jgi:hypothetical protein